jgi:very-short-patch-repair endonuclease
VSDAIQLLPSEPLPDRLVQAEELTDEYRRLRQDITGRGVTRPVPLRDALANLGDDEVVAAVDPLSRRQRFTQADKEAYAKHLRDHMTSAEWCLWQELEPWNADGIEVRAQEIVRGWIVDFYLPAFRIVIEVDGGIHSSGPQWQRDRHKEAVLERDGYTVVRFTNSQAMDSTSYCTDRLMGLITSGEVTHAR